MNTASTDARRKLLSTSLASKRPAASRIPAPRRSSERAEVPILGGLSWIHLDGLGRADQLVLRRRRRWTPGTMHAKVFYRRCGDHHSQDTGRSIVRWWLHRPGRSHRRPRDQHVRALRQRRRGEHVGGLAHRRDAALVAASGYVEPTQPGAACRCARRRSGGFYWSECIPPRAAGRQERPSSELAPTCRSTRCSARLAKPGTRPDRPIRHGCDARQPAARTEQSN